MGAGKHINSTEDRAVMHIALRAPKTEIMMVDGVDVVSLSLCPYNSFKREPLSLFIDIFRFLLCTRSSIRSMTLPHASARATGKEPLERHLPLLFALVSGDLFSDPSSSLRP